MNDSIMNDGMNEHTADADANADADADADTERRNVYSMIE